MAAETSDRQKGSILIIDDEPNLLKGIQRQLHKRFDLVLAEGGDQGLALLQEQGPCAVVVCDMNMPGKTGIEVLAKVAEISPDTIRIMLTGQADLTTAMEAVNHGNIFRFFTKPCASDVLAAGLEAGLEQYSLVTAERDLLNKTLSGSIKLLTDILALTDPDSFGRTDQMRRWCRKIAEKLGLKKHTWKLELATMLAPIGLAALPPEVAAKVRSKALLSAVEQEMVDATAETAHNLICNIPRLSEAATYVLYQNKNFDGTGFPKDERAGAEIPVGARIIRILNALIAAKELSMDIQETLNVMRRQDRTYDPKLVDLVKSALLDEAGGTSAASLQKIQIDLWKMQPGDVLQTPIEDVEQHHLVLAAGATITELHIKRLGNLRRLRQLTETVIVERPAHQASKAFAG